MRAFYTRLTAILIFAGVVLNINSSAQNPPGYETISTAQGLSQGMVFDILQDAEGFLWVATKNGLNRYDGYSFKVFANDPYNARSLSSNSIVKLFEDARGRIWVGTENSGLNVYEKKTGKFYRIENQLTNAGSLSGNAIRLIEGLPDGRVLVAADGAGLNIIDLKADLFAKDAKSLITRLALPNDAQVYGMGQDNNGTMWIGGMDGSVYSFNPLKNSFTPFKNGQLLNNGFYAPDKSILINGSLFLYDGKKAVPLFDTTRTLAGNIIFKPREKLWENFHRELSFYDVSKWEPGKQPDWSLALPESTRTVYPFITDRSGIMWSGSVGYGLRKYNLSGSKFKVQNPGISTRWIIPVTSHDIYTGDFGYGWKRIKNDLTEHSPFRNIPTLTQVDNFIVASNGDFWIKSDNKGFFNYNPVSGRLTPHPEINNYEGMGDKQPMLQDSKGALWFPGRGGTFQRFHTATGKVDSFSINSNAARPMLPKSICTALYEDKQGIFWIGTAEGFAKLEFNSKTYRVPAIKWFYNDPKSRNSLNYNHVSCFLDDPMQPEKYLWICTKGGGLNRLNKTTGDFMQLTTKQGLPNDVLYGILPDDAGNIWGSSNMGIFCLFNQKKSDSSQWIFRNFTKAYGLQDDEFNTGAYARLPNGNLAFGGVNGLNIFDPKEILKTNFTPAVFITNMLINNKPVNPGDKTGVLQSYIEQTKSVTLNYLQDILTLEFSSLDFTAPNQNKYRYQLIGIDKDWVESGNRRSATYLHLPAGNYKFKVQGSNSQGIWSDKTVELQITVLPPWWRSWWAFAIYAIIIGLVVKAWFNFSVNRAKLKSQLSFEQLEAKRVRELDTLKTQLYTNITHEFRTPLTVILGMAQQVINKPAEHLDNGMAMIIRNGQSLLNLVNEMLDLSKLETGKMELQLVNADIIHYLRYTVESFHSLAESQHKHVHFLAEIDTLHVAFDHEKIRQIISNLLSNALKFTAEKGNIYITVSESAVLKDAQQTSLVVQVKDTGIGIPEAQLQHIFDRFYQLDNSHTRKTGGTGIGLALTKELVKLMNGDIVVKSPPTGANKGTAFILTLPITRASTKEKDFYPETDSIEQHTTRHPPTPAVVDIELQQPHADRSLILLVEDNADVVAYTASCLPDYKLAVAKDGREGFDIACQVIPDLVITDVMMPFVDGFELCRKLRADEHTSHIPIIMLTAKADIESKIEGLELGADVYLEKPFNREELLVRIKKLLEMRQQLQKFYLKKAGLITHDLPVEIVGEDSITDTKIEDAFVKKIRTLVEDNLAAPGFTVEHLCKLVYMSHSQMHRKLEALTGCSPNKFIRIIRLNKAKALLQKADNSIAYIAQECGYNDPGYFARVFKQEYQVTPQEWRLVHETGSYTGKSSPDKKPLIDISQ